MVPLIASFAFLGVVLVVFHVEHQRGIRFLEKTRAAGDRAALRLFVWHERTLATFRSNAVQQTIHYILHLALLAVSSIFRWITTRFDELIRVNRSLARRTAQSSREVERHLVEMMAHKKQTALSELEKRRRKEQAIGGRL